MTFNKFFHNNQGVCNSGEYISLDLEYFTHLKPKLQEFMASPSNVLIIDGNEHHDIASTIYSGVLDSITDGLICIIDPKLVPCGVDKKLHANSSSHKNARSGNHRDGESYDEVHYATVLTKTGEILKKHYYNTWEDMESFVRQHQKSLVLIINNPFPKKDPCFYKNVLGLGTSKTIISVPGTLNKKVLNGSLSSNQIELFTLPGITMNLMTDHIESLFQRFEVSYDNKNTLAAIVSKSEYDIPRLNGILHTLMFQMYIRRNKHLTLQDLRCLDTPTMDKGSTVNLHSHTRNILTVAIPVVMITVPLTLFSYSKWDYTMVMINSSKIYKSITSKVYPRTSSTPEAVISDVNASGAVSFASINDTSINDTSINDTSINDTSINDTSINDTPPANISTLPEIVEVADLPEPTPTLGSAILEMEPEIISLPSYATVTARVLNLRSHPRLNSTVLLQSRRNTRLEVVDSASQPDWVLVREAGGVEAWVSRDFVILSP